jgi:ribonuclease J
MGPRWAGAFPCQCLGSYFLAMSGLNVRVHRGTREIGGNCVELEARGERLLLDLGRPLGAKRGEAVSLPAVDGLADTGALAGLVISHPHQDHYGLAHLASPKVPMFMGEAAHRILKEAAFFTPSGLERKPTGFLRHRRSMTMGPFTVTPFLNDHSAFDAYSLLIEAQGRRLFYTGDIRGHGRKKGAFEALLHKPPPAIDAMLMEGTHVRAHSDGTECGPSEDEVEEECVRTFRSTRGAALMCYSAQNIDGMVTLYRAAKRAGREFVMDLYTATIAAATGRDSIPQAGWEGVRVFVPRSQRRAILKAKAFERIEAIRAQRIFPEELRARRSELAVTFRHSMAAELIRAGCLENARLVWSLWPGYLKDESGRALLAVLAEQGVGLAIHHSSGHAYIPDLRRLVEAVVPGRVVPMHSEATDHFARFFPRVERHADREWWPV